MKGWGIEERGQSNISAYSRAKGKKNVTWMAWFASVKWLSQFDRHRWAGREVEGTCHCFSGGSRRCCGHLVVLLPLVPLHCCSLVSEGGTRRWRPTWWHNGNWQNVGVRVGSRLSKKRMTPSIITSAPKKVSPIPIAAHVEAPRWWHIDHGVNGNCSRWLQLHYTWTNVKIRLVNIIDSFQAQRRDKSRTTLQTIVEMAHSLWFPCAGDWVALRSH